MLQRLLMLINFKMFLQSTTKNIFFNSLPEGKAYLKQQIHALKEKVASHHGSALLHAALASYQDLLQDTSSALNSLNIAAKLDPQDKNIAWLHLKVQRGKELEDKRSSLHEHLLQFPSFEYKMAQPVEVRVIFPAVFIICTALRVSFVYWLAHQINSNIAHLHQMSSCI